MRSILVSLLFLIVSGSVAATEVNRIVLRVNDRITTLHDFEQRRAERVLQVQRAEMPAEEKRELIAGIGETVLRQMYEESLLLSRADQLGVRASEQEVERNFRDTVDSLGIQGEEELAQALAASGMTEEALRAQIRRGMVIQEVIGREIRPRITLEEEEMRRYYRDHIADFEAPARWQVQDAVVLGASGAGTAAGAEIAADIVSRIEDGESLAVAANDYVELGKVTMIELGWVARGDLEPSLEAALVELGAGEVGEPVAGRGGLHILAVAAFEEARPRTFPEVESQISEILQKDRFANEMQTYLEELAASSYVATDPPPGAEGFQAGLGVEGLGDAGALYEPAGGEGSSKAPDSEADPDPATPPSSGAA